MADYTQEDVEELAQILFDGLYYDDWGEDWQGYDGAERAEDARIACRDQARAALCAGYRRVEGAR